MNKKNWVFWVVALVIVGAIIWYLNRSDDNNTAVNSESQQSTPTSTIDTTASSTEAAPKVYVGTAKSTTEYTKAVESYQYRIQFKDCHGTLNNTMNAGTLSIKKGVKFMLDNRDPVAHTIAFKGTSVKIAGYGYAIVTPTVLGTYPITCDGGGAAVLNVE
jgi:hypothetical protein